MLSQPNCGSIQPQPGPFLIQRARSRDDEFDRKMPSENPDDKKEGEARAKAFEQMYKESHSNGPYLPIELKPKPELKP